MFDALAQPFTEHPPQNQNNNNNVGPYSPVQNRPNFQLVDMFPDMAEDPLSDDCFLDAINKIERENAQLIPKPPLQNPVNPLSNVSNITSNYVQNVHPNVPFPHMNFNNSNVMINYNFNQK